MPPILADFGPGVTPFYFAIGFLSSPSQVLSLLRPFCSSLFVPQSLFRIVSSFPLVLSNYFSTSEGWSVPLLFLGTQSLSPPETDFDWCPPPPQLGPRLPKHRLFFPFPHRGGLPLTLLSLDVVSLSFTDASETFDVFPLVNFFLFFLVKRLRVCREVSAAEVPLTLELHHHRGSTLFVRRFIPPAEARFSQRPAVFLLPQAP